MTKPILRHTIHLLFKVGMMLRRKFFFVFLLTVGFTDLGCGENSDPHSKEDILAQLISLKPLPKTHYSWALAPELFKKENNQLLNELTRIMGSISISTKWTNKNQIDRCVYLCARLNKLNLSDPYTIGINLSPWHRKFGKDLPPTDRGQTYAAELQFFKERLTLIKKWIETSNQKYQSHVQVGALMLDSERFHVQKENITWNNAIRKALDDIHRLGQDLFPKARIEWYGRGIKRDRSPTGWSKTSLFTGQEIKAPLSCSLYTLPELQTMRETYRRTCDLADTLGIKSVTPWVALASGYQRHIIKFNKWNDNWDYDLAYSWMLGAELNIDWYSQKPKRFAPYNRGQIVIFYPAPFAKKSPHWAKHFIAYARGATGIKDIGDLNR